MLYAASCDQREAHSALCLAVKAPALHVMACQHHIDGDTTAEHARQRVMAGTQPSRHVLTRARQASSDTSTVMQRRRYGCTLLVGRRARHDHCAHVRLLVCQAVIGC